MSLPNMKHKTVLKSYAVNDHELLNVVKIKLFLATVMY